MRMREFKGKGGDGVKHDLQPGKCTVTYNAKWSAQP